MALRSKLPRHVARYIAAMSILILLVGGTFRIWQLRQRRPVDLWNLAVAAQKAGDYALAEVHLRKVVALLPDNARVRVELSKVVLKQQVEKNPDADYATTPEAFRLLQQAAALEAGSVELQLLLMRTWERMGRRKEAVEVAEKLHARTAGNLNTIRFLFNARIDEGALNKAAQLLHSLENIAGRESPTAFLHRARLYEAQGRTAELHALLELSAHLFSRQSRHEIYQTERFAPEDFDDWFKYQLHKSHSSQKKLLCFRNLRRCLESLKVLDRSNEAKCRRALQAAELIIFHEERFAKSNLDKAFDTDACNSLMQIANQVTFSGPSYSLQQLAVGLCLFRTGHGRKAFKPLAHALIKTATTEDPLRPELVRLALASAAELAQEDGWESQLKPELDRLIQHPSTAGVSHFLLACSQIHQGDSVTAAALAKKASQTLPDKESTLGLSVRLAGIRRDWLTVVRLLDRMKSSYGKPSGWGPWSHHLLGDSREIADLHLLALTNTGHSNDAETIAELRISGRPALDVLKLRAKSLVKASRYSDAKSVLESASRIAPADTQVLQSLVAVLVSEQNLSAAKRLTAGFLRTNPNVLTARLLHGEILLRSGNASSAADYLLQTKARFPSSRDASVMAAQACQAAGRIREAENLLAETEQHQADSLTSILSRASVALNDSRYQEALTILTRVQNRYQHVALYQLAVGRAYAGLGDHTTAAQQFLNAVSSRHCRQQAILALIASLDSCERSTGVESAGKLVAEINNKLPAENSLLCHAATIAFRADQFDVAESILKRIRKPGPSQRNVLGLRIAIHEKRGEFDQALEAVQTAISAGNDDVALHQSRIYLLCKLGRWEAADQQARRFSEQQDTVDADRRLMQTFDRAGWLPAAISWGTKALSRLDQGSSTHSSAVDSEDRALPRGHADLISDLESRLAEISLRNWASDSNPQSLDETIARHERLLSNRPVNRDLLNTLAWLHGVEAGNHEHANMLCDRLLASTEDSDLSLEQLDTIATVFRLSNRTPEARELVEQAIRRHPDSARLHFQKGMLLAAASNLPATSLQSEIRAEFEAALSHGLSASRRETVAQILKTIESTTE